MTIDTKALRDAAERMKGPWDSSMRVNPDAILALLDRLEKLERVAAIAKKQQETTYYGMSDWQIEASERMMEALKSLEQADETDSQPKENI